MSQQQKGFGLVEVIIIVVLLIGVGVGAWYVWQNQQGRNNSSTGTNQNGSPSADKTYADACQLVDRADVEEAFGVPFGEFKREDGGTSSAGFDGSSCAIEQAHDGSVSAMTDAVNVSIKIENYETGDAAKQAMEATKGSAKLGDKVYFVRTDVNGVGDEAFFFQGQAPLVLKTEEFMYVRKGSQIFHFVAVRLDGIDHAKAQTALTELAKKALN